ncbi:MAG: hypothetical protein MHM6MM_000246 [Cercozoa sp. M6MM]
MQIHGFEALQWREFDLQPIALSFVCFTVLYEVAKRAFAHVLPWPAFLQNIEALRKHKQAKIERRALRRQAKLEKENKTSQTTEAGAPVKRTTAPIEQCTVSESDLKLAQQAHIRDITNRFVSSAHAVVCVALTVMLVLRYPLPTLSDDETTISARTFLSNEVGFMQTSMSLGYFLWDLAWLVCNWTGSPLDWQYVVHHALCLFIYGNCLMPCATYYASIFLAWELSTIPLNIRYCLRLYGGEKRGQLFQRIVLFVELAFVVSFVGIRYVFGYISSLWYWRDTLTIQYAVATGATAMSTTDGANRLR